MYKTTLYAITNGLAMVFCGAAVTAPSGTIANTVCNFCALMAHAASGGIMYKHDKFVSVGQVALAFMTNVPDMFLPNVAEAPFFGIGMVIRNNIFGFGELTAGEKQENPQKPLMKPRMP